MKKVSLKKEIGGILDNLQEVERPAIYDGCPKEYKYQEGSFKCYVGTDVLSLEDAKKMIAENADRLNRNLRHFHASELNERSNNFQKALAYIGEHRHLIPFFRFLYDWTHEHPDKSVQDCIREYRKAHKVLPSELIGESGWGRSTYYRLGTKQPELATVIAQIPVLPKAWML